jgi:hypothetical protein
MIFVTKKETVFFQLPESESKNLEFDRIKSRISQNSTELNLEFARIRQN